MEHWKKEILKYENLRLTGQKFGTLRSAPTKKMSSSHFVCPFQAAERAQIEYKDRKIFGIIPAVGKIATQIVPLDTFWPAETYHKVSSKRALAQNVEMWETRGMSRVSMGRHTVSRSIRK